MAKRKKDTMEFRFYELPQGESALVLCGESWKRVYGHEEFHLHFHNLLEIGIWMRIFTSIMTAISHLYLRIFHMLQSAMVRW